VFLGNYARISSVDSLLRVPGVAQVLIFGAADYAMRIWVRPALLAKLGLTVLDLSNAIRQQSTVNPAGQLGASPAEPSQETTFTVRTQGRLETAEEFGRIVVRSNADGSVVRLQDVARVELGTLNLHQSVQSVPRGSIAG
jgi:HAE1 family hydrophobic/amphiphilic exporter-1